MVAITLKWGKQVFENVDVKKSGSVTDMKKKIQDMTFVPIERQKLMAKGIWKGILKDEEDLNSLEKLQDGAQIMLMGSAEVFKEPETKVLFVEDMTTKEIAEARATAPSGLNNLGNTCYLNSTLQCLRFIPEFREALNIHPRGSSSDLANILTTSLGDAYRQMDSSVASTSPIIFVETLRRAFPQFAQISKKGGFMQQDSEEFLSTIFNTLSQNLRVGKGVYENCGGASNMIEALFGLDLEETLTCTETEAEKEIKKIEKSFKLVCNINIDINHMNEGIQLGLEGTIEKNSDVLGRNAIWKKSMKVNKLPKYLCVQFMRFYWKLTPDSRDHTGVKCKMLRPINFPTTLDVFNMCSDELKGILKIWRDKHANEILNEFKREKEGKKSEGEEKTKTDILMEDVCDEDKQALEEAKALSMGQTREPGIGLPYQFQGNYELFAVVTHKGRSADSGHYIGWVRDKDGRFFENKTDTQTLYNQINTTVDDWFCYDDDEVSPCKTEDIQKLKGGGDWHMTYLTFYRAKF